SAGGWGVDVNDDESDSSGVFFFFTRKGGKESSLSVSGRGDVLKETGKKAFGGVGPPPPPPPPVWENINMAA
ncbi:hypothetical protein COH83_12975, partial [Neisseria meningitidis]